MDKHISIAHLFTASQRINHAAQVQQPISGLNNSGLLPVPATFSPIKSDDMDLKTYLESKNKR